MGESQRCNNRQRKTNIHDVEHIDHDPREMESAAETSYHKRQTKPSEPIIIPVTIA